MDIENGWRFHSADFSLQDSGKSAARGIVTLVREVACNVWLELSGGRYERWKFRLCVLSG